MNPQDDQPTSQDQRPEANDEQDSAAVAGGNRDAGATAADGAENEPFAPDAGSPGGMGGVRSSGDSGTGRPPGGVSPVQDD